MQEPATEGNIQQLDIPELRFKLTEALLWLAAIAPVGGIVALCFEKPDLVMASLVVCAGATVAAYKMNPKNEVSGIN